MRKNVFQILTALAVFVCAFCAAENAWAVGPWEYRTSHGMQACEFSAVAQTRDSINGGERNPGNHSVTVEGQSGSAVTLRLFCRREQSLDSNGHLTGLGPEVAYSGPFGQGREIGQDMPSTGRRDHLPKGREWSVWAGNSPTTYRLTGGQDWIDVTVVPEAAPATVPWVQTYVGYQVAPVAEMANQAYEAATTYDYKDRVISITGSYILHLDTAVSIPKGSDASQGFGVDIDVTLGGQSKVKFLTGLTMDMMFRQKKIAFAPSAPTNGDNNYVAWQTFYVAPKAGVSYMPTKWFDLSAYASIGALVSIDGTIPVSQLQNMELYIGESKTTAALGYKTAACPAFLIGDHFKVGACIGLQGNFSPLPASRGPERVANADGSVLVRRDGHFVNFPFGLFAGGQF